MALPVLRVSVEGLRVPSQAQPRARLCQATRPGCTNHGPLVLTLSAGNEEHGSRCHGIDGTPQRDRRVRHGEEVGGAVGEPLDAFLDGPAPSEPIRQPGLVARDTVRGPLHDEPRGSSSPPPPPRWPLRRPSTGRPLRSVRRPRPVQRSEQRRLAASFIPVPRRNPIATALPSWPRHYKQREKDAATQLPPGSPRASTLGVSSRRHAATDRGRGRDGMYQPEG